LNNYLKKFQPDFSNSISTIVQEITIYQQNFYQTVRKVSLVSQSLDGKLLSGNVPRVYNTSGTSEISSTSDPATSDTLVELKNDFERFISVLPRFNTVVSENYNIFTNNYFDGKYQTPFTDEFTTTNEDWDKYFYMVICRILTDSAKLDAFQTDLNNGFEGDNQLVRRINRIVDDVVSRYKKQIREEEKYMKDFKKVQDYKKFVDGLNDEMYVKGKLRKFNYNTTPNTDVQTNGEKIKDLYLNPFKFK
jgi:hypothetical protein